MDKLTRSDLLSLEAYAAQRDDFRQRAIAHKRTRTVAVGPNVTLLFEDRLTVHYQVQEMLRIERIFEAAGIDEELAAYNPLIPDGSNLKATMLIEFPDEHERRAQLARLAGIEHQVYAEVEGHGRASTFADEDLDRSSDGKTSAVHFLRFEFTPAQVRALGEGAALGFGVADDRMRVGVTAASPLREALMADLAGS